MPKNLEPQNLKPLQYRLVNHLCHFHQGTRTVTLPAGQGIYTAGRPSLFASLYSASVATQTTTPPRS